MAWQHRVNISRYLQGISERWTRMLQPVFKALYALCCLAGLALRNQAKAQDNHASPVLILKDPTPRSPDLSKVYGKPADPAATPTSLQVANYNRRRFALIAHASNEIATLAKTLQKALAEEQSEAMLRQEAEVSSAIATLAGDVHMAVVPRGRGQAKERVGADKRAIEAGAADGAQVRSKVDTLVTLAEGMHTEVDKSEPDTLSVGVFTKSQQVRDLAHELTLRLQRRSK